MSAKVGDKLELDVKQFGLNGDIKWQSFNPSVATIDNNGNLTVVKEGKAKIIAQLGNQYVEYNIDAQNESTNNSQKGRNPENSNSGNNGGDSGGGSTPTPSPAPAPDPGPTPGPTPTERVLTGITIKNIPAKTVYIKGENLDLTGGKITLSYSDGTMEEKEITADMVSGFDSQLPGNQTLTVTYKDKITSFDITVTNEVVEIQITKLPKIEYEQDEVLNLSGGQITATKQNGECETINMTDREVTVRGYDKRNLGVQILTVSYKEKTATYSVTVGKVLKIGSYVNYEDVVKSGIYSKEKLGLNYTGYANTDDITTQAGLKWRILDVDKQMGTVQLISTPTSSNVYFKGAVGYQNGVDIMNDICKTLYSSESKNIEARSVNMRDIEKHLTVKGKRERDEYSFDGIKYGETNTYLGDHSFYPKAYYEEEASGRGTKKEWEPLGIKTNREYAQAETLTTKQTYYFIPLSAANYGEAASLLYNSKSYWIASRFAYCLSTTTSFGLRTANSNMTGNNIFYSHEETKAGVSSLRAVVTLPYRMLDRIHEGTESDPFIIK